MFEDQMVEIYSNQNLAEVNIFHQQKLPSVRTHFNDDCECETAV